MRDIESLNRRVATIEKHLRGGVTDLTQLLIEHQFTPVNHSSIGMEHHCRCGFRPRHWGEWAEHVTDVANAT
ncbi:hypothetical protein A5622_15920 [Mycobacterium sp. 1245801.1]|nr:hypothetical protein A5622_15920 [Mycobacterium sp. 1245801.1]